MNDTASTEIATLGGGCFWCLDAVFLRVAGVTAVDSGYAGGRVANPSYREVCEGTTGHAEVVRVHFDPAQIGYRDLLEIFFAIHDPTTLNRQGHDIGTQYRSVIFTHSLQQRAEALSVINALNAAGAYRAPIVTEVVDCPAFYPAEEYHQRYFDQNPHQPYCMAVVGPKVEKFLHRFALRVK